MSRTRVDQPGVPPRTWNFSPGKVGLSQPGHPGKSDSQTPPWTRGLGWEQLSPAPDKCKLQCKRSTPDSLSSLRNVTKIWRVLIFLQISAFQSDEERWRKFSDLCRVEDCCAQGTSPSSPDRSGPWAFPWGRGQDSWAVCSTAGISC